MANDDTPEPEKTAPPKKVVKKVVKKAAPAKAAPTIRYGRTVAPADEPVAKAPKVESRPAKKSAPKKAAAKAGTAVEDREDPNADLGTKPDDAVDFIEPDEPVKKAARVPSVDVDALRGRASDGVQGARDRFGDVLIAVRNRLADARDFLADKVDDARAVRPPVIDPIPASWLTGLFVGVLSVLLGIGALELFSVTRGVSSGGGFWGLIAIVVVAAVGFVVGERLLDALGTPQPRLTSGLAIMLTFIGLLLFFNETADSWYGLFVIPSLSAVCFTASHWMTSVTEEPVEA